MKTNKTNAKKTNKTTKVSKTTKVASKSNGVAKDNFGTRLGTQCAKINAALSKKPIEAKMIAKKTKAPFVAVYNHLRTLLGKKLVKQTDNGWVSRVA